MGTTYVSSVFCFFPPYMESDTWEKHTNSSATSRFSARTPLMILLIVRICEVVDKFLRNPFGFFLRMFFNVWIDTIEKKGIRNLNNYWSKTYGLVVWSDSAVTFLRERKDIVFRTFHFFALVWIGLVSLFNGISTFVGYLTPNPSF